MDTAWHRKKLEAELARIDATIDAEVARISEAEANPEPSHAMPEAMRDAAARKDEIKRALAELASAQVEHLHPAEPEAKVMKLRGGQRTLAYNAQAVADHDSDLIVAQDVTSDQTDHAQLVPMMEAVGDTLGRVAEQTVADAGYYGGAQIAEAERRHLPVLVSIQEESGTKGDFNKSRFSYDSERDGYVCPRGELLPKWRTTPPCKDKPYSMTIYRCHNRTCPVRAQCSSDASGRTIKRSPYEDALARQAAKNALPAMRILLSLRGEIIEHVFGIAKAIDGFRRFTVRSLEKARTQWALVCTAINLRKLHAHWLRTRTPVAA